MGDRSWIVISDDVQSVSLYGHWSGTDNVTAARNVLERTDRIGDFGYLVAQMFHEFTSLGGYSGNTGFGIYPSEFKSWEENPTVYVNANTGEMKVIDYDYDTAEPTVVG